MTIRTLDEKMAFELQGIYDAEHQFLEAQQEMQKQASSDTVRSMLEKHIEQTQQQITNLEQVFDLLGQQVKRTKCHGAAGLVSDGQKLLKQVGDNDALVDLAIAGSNSKVEHYEIAAYRGLIEGATIMGNAEVLSLLERNLEQEEQTAQKLEQSMPKLLEQAMSAQEAGG